MDREDNIFETLYQMVITYNKIKTKDKCTTESLSFNAICDI